MSDMDTGGPARDPRPDTVRETETVRHTVRETGPGTVREAGPGRGAGGTNLILVLLVAVVLGLVVWVLMSRGGDEGGVDVNVPSVEVPDANVEVREPGT